MQKLEDAWWKEEAKSRKKADLAMKLELHKSLNSFEGSGPASPGLSPSPSGALGGGETPGLSPGPSASGMLKTLQTGLALNMAALLSPQ